VAAVMRTGCGSDTFSALHFRDALLRSWRIFSNVIPVFAIASKTRIGRAFWPPSKSSGSGTARCTSVSLDCDRARGVGCLSKHVQAMAHWTSGSSCRSKETLARPLAFCGRWACRALPTSMWPFTPATRRKEREASFLQFLMVRQSFGTQCQAPSEPVL